MCSGVDKTVLSVLFFRARCSFTGLRQERPCLCYTGQNNGAKKVKMLSSSRLPKETFLSPRRATSCPLFVCFNICPPFIALMHSALSICSDMILNRNAIGMRRSGAKCGSVDFGAVTCWNKQHMMRKSWIRLHSLPDYRAFL